METVIVVSVSVETNLVVGPVRVVDLITGGENELLIDAGRVTRFKGENGRFRARALDLVATIIKTET